MDGKQFITPAFAVTVLLLGLVGFVVAMVFFGNPPASNDVQVMVITAVVINGLQEIRKYWLNSNSESEAKNVTIAQQARTAAVTQDALLDPAVTVTAGAKPAAKAVLADPGMPVSESEVSTERKAP